MSTRKATIRIELPVAVLAVADIDWPEGAEPQPTISLFETDDPARSVVEIFAPGPVDEDELTEFLGRLSAVAGHDIPAPLFETLAEKDWVSESQRLRQPVDAGRFTICEANQRADIAAEREIIVIEAGQAFGTGGHQSTKGCLIALDALAATVTPRRALDLGTGSGVLAIAMARLWDIPILASDIDPVATRTAAENIAINCATGVETVTADGVDDPAIVARAPFDLITANILAGPLIAMAPRIAGILALGAFLVLSGITREQAAEVAAAYGEAGFEPQARIALDDWCTLVFTRDT